MPTIRDVAQLAGTSSSAVSAVINGSGRLNIRVGEATQERIRAAAATLGYSPNHQARSLVTGKNGVLGLVFPYSSAFIGHDPFCAQIMSGVFEEVVREKHNLMLQTATGDDWNAADARSLLDSRVDGLLLVLPLPDSSVVEQCRRLPFPYVALAYAPTQDDDFTVNADEVTGGRLATEHLISLGHRRIAHLSGNEFVATTPPRRAGYRQALQEAGITERPELLVPAGFHVEGGYDGMQRLLALPKDQQPTAVFAANDLCAEGALRALREAGLRVPDDMALVGYDDTWFATMVQPALTTVRMPIAEMGRRATELLIAQVEGKNITERQITLPVSLTIRDSCGGRNHLGLPSEVATKE